MMMITKDEIIKQVNESKHNKVWVAVSDIDGKLMGKMFHRQKFLSDLEKGGVCFCNGIFGIDIAGVMFDNVQVTGWQTGFPDARTMIDIGTIRKIPWKDDMLFFLADFSNNEGETSLVCPRTLLKRIIKKMTDNYYVPIISMEFEWYNFEGNSQDMQEKGIHNLPPLTHGDFVYSFLKPHVKQDYFYDLFDKLEAFGIPLECMHTEFGPGVYEASIQHTTALEAADRAVLLKTGVKEIARRHGIIPSFMAKISNNDIGCGGHIHQSLYESNQKNNLFYDNQNEHNMSSLMKNYIAGQLKCLPEIMPIFAPVVNSYKRLQDGSLAPTTLTWGLDNRSVALRIFSEDHESTRIEHRVAGSDVNPYLAIAACLASGLYGIENNLQLDMPQTSGNAYNVTQFGKFPENLKEATDQMKNSQIAKELFGKSFTDHFVKTREWEWSQYLNHVSDWELKRYFETI